jgi:hypothetical protein
MEYIYTYSYTHIYTNLGEIPIEMNKNPIQSDRHLEDGNMDRNSAFNLSNNAPKDSKPTNKSDDRNWQNKLRCEYVYIFICMFICM